jgi:predicted RNA binding protein YcfA (HicA-like mRNA interferase family)
LTSQLATLSVTEIFPVEISSSMKVRDAIERVEADGWYLDRTKGSHRQFKHPDKLGLFTVPDKLSDDLAPGTLSSIWRQAQL